MTNWEEADLPDLRQVAREGSTQAQFELACRYDFCPPKRRRLAVKWYRRAAEQGHAEAQKW